jgi:hypothetical protein
MNPIRRITAMILIVAEIANCPDELKPEGLKTL